MAVIVEDFLLGLLSDARTLQALKGKGNGRARDSTGASVEEIALTVRKALAAECAGKFPREDNMRHAIIAVLVTFVLATPAGTAVAGPFEDAVSANDRGDYATAVREFRVLAAQGHAIAQYSLGVMYSKGQGVPQDYAVAVKWYRKAAEQGDAVTEPIFDGG